MRWLSGLLLASTLTTAQAQTFEVKGYADAGLSFLNVNTGAPTGKLLLDGQLNLNLTAGSWKVVGTLQPWLTFLPEASGGFGVSEAYARYTHNDLEVALGVQRTALETARLGFPYLLDRLDALGQHLGRPALSASWNPERGRYRLVLLAESGGVTPVFSVRHEFAQAEAEGHLLWRGGQLVAGLGASGTVRELVLYGEVWALHNFGEVRFAAGLSGNLPQDKGLWTLEGGRAPLPLSAGPADFYLAAQANMALNDDQSLALTASAWPLNPAGAATLTYTKSQDDHELRAFFTGTFMNGQPGFGLGLTFRHYFAWDNSK